jgi:hypothetical protein
VNTRPCPICGHPLTADARFCSQCGSTIDPNVHEEVTVARDSSKLLKTLLEESPFGSQQMKAAAAAKAPSDPALGQTLADPLKTDAIAAQLAATDPAAKPADAAPVMKTMMLGGTTAPEKKPEKSPLSASVYSPGGSDAPVVASVSPSGPPTPILAPGSDKRTMLGMPAADLPPPQQGPPQQEQPLRTMLGVAMPGIAPTGTSSDAPPPGPGPAFASEKGTILGVAVPGIAPTGGGPPIASRVQATQQLPMAPPPIIPAPPPLIEEPLPEAPAVPHKRGVPVFAVILIVFVITALLGGAGAWVALRTGGPLTAQPQLDESGKESLKLGCPTCPDGTTVTLGASAATVQSGTAVLPLPVPLSIGENDLVVKLDRPGTGRDEEVKVHVPVAYRVRADLTTLSARPPVITVRVEATPGSDVKIDDKPLALDGNGKGSYAIDLSHDTDGPSDDAKTFDRKIPFAITPKGGKPESGQLIARTGIVPLHIDAPGLWLTTDRPNAPVAGQTRPGATVTIDGAAAPVDAQGKFGVRVPIPDNGDKTLEIVASSPPLAPRIVHTKVTRVASLVDAAKDAASQSPLTYDGYAADPASKAGQKVAVEGEVVEARTGQGHAVLLVEEKKGCPKGQSCLVRVTHGEEVHLNHGDHVRAYGRITGVVSASGKSVPDIDAAIVIAVKK